MSQTKVQTPDYSPSHNACKQCNPLGASLAFKGIKNCMPLIHGSQGCATYIRRYLISHFREPVDIASSSFHEDAAVFGGNSNLSAAIDNIINGYSPEVIGICTTCLSETIGDDLSMLIHQYKQSHDATKSLPHIVHVQTPSYAGSQAEGFHAAVFELVKKYAQSGTASSNPLKQFNLFAGMISPADIRELKRLETLTNSRFIIVPDYSDTLDGGSWDDYHLLPPGGTSIDDLRDCGASHKSIRFGHVASALDFSADGWLHTHFATPAHVQRLPIGLEAMDSFLQAIYDKTSILETMHPVLLGERSRLVDSYMDGHKYVFGKRAAIFGDEDLVVALSAFLAEIGIKPVYCASGGKSKLFNEQLATLPAGYTPELVQSGVDFDTIHNACEELQPDILIGNSKGYYIAKELNIPLVRTGFPIHDRFGAQRMLHIGYQGTQQLFDTIVNSLLEQKQSQSSIGYKYL
jgi:nitrogenase molybdenum-iron protein NifN